MECFQEKFGQVSKKITILWKTTVLLKYWFTREISTLISTSKNIWSLYAVYYLSLKYCIMVSKIAQYLQTNKKLITYLNLKMQNAWLFIDTT